MVKVLLRCKKCENFSTFGCFGMDFRFQLGFLTFGAQDDFRVASPVNAWETGSALAALAADRLAVAEKALALGGKCFGGSKANRSFF